MGKREIEKSVEVQNTERIARCNFCGSEEEPKDIVSVISASELRGLQRGRNRIPSSDSIDVDYESGKIRTTAGMADIICGEILLDRTDIHLDEMCADAFSSEVPK